MKKIYSFSRILAILALLFVGLGSAWAETTTIYSETFGSGVGSNTDWSNAGTYFSDANTSTYASTTTWRVSKSTTSPCSVNGSSANSHIYAAAVGSEITFSFGDITEYENVVFSCNFANNASTKGNRTITIQFSGDGGETWGTDQIGANTSQSWQDFSANVSSTLLSDFAVKITNTSSNTSRVDDVLLVGELADDDRTEVNITSFSATTTNLTIGGTTTTTTSVTNDQNAWTPAYTYTSNNMGVATVDATGLITALSEGTAEITVALNIAKNDATWKKGATYSKTVTITVVDPNPHILSTTFDFVNNNYGLTQGADMSGAYVAENTVVSSDLVNIKFAASSAARYGTYNSKAELRIYKLKDIKFSVPAGCKITKITLDSREDRYHYPAQNGTEPIIWTGKAEEVTIQFVGSTQVIQSITVDYQTPQPVQVAVSNAGYATYAPATDMVITEEDAVFYASEVTHDAIEFTALAVGAKVVAGEGLLVKGEGNHDFIPTVGATAIPSNELIGVLEATDLSTVENAYILALDNGVAAFCPVSGGSLAAGKAYLVRPAAGGSAPALRIIFAGEEEHTATSVEEIAGENNVVKFFENGQIYILKAGRVYNVAGQMVK